MAALEFLIGLCVDKVEELHDYIQLVFSDGATLTIFNNYVYDSDSIRSIEGKKVKSLIESVSGIVLVFDGGEKLSIGLQDNDYHGPEAMVLSRKGMPNVVWN